MYIFLNIIYILGVLESTEVSAAANQHDGRVPVSVTDPNRNDAARVIQEFVRIVTGKTIPLKTISSRYTTQINQIYSNLVSHQAQSEQC